MTSKHERGLNVNTENSGDAKGNKEVDIGKGEEEERNTMKRNLDQTCSCFFCCFCRFRWKM